MHGSHTFHLFRFLLHGTRALPLLPSSLHADIAIVSRTLLPLPSTRPHRHFPTSSHQLPLCSSRPRYHFAAAENTFWQRVPYWCRPVAGSAIAATRQATLTRFIGLGTVPAPNADTTDKVRASFDCRRCVCICGCTVVVVFTNRYLHLKAKKYG